MAIVPPGKQVPLAQQAVRTTALTQSVIDTLRNVYTNVKDLVYASPGQPILPTNPEEQPRLRTPFAGSNLNPVPRTEGFDANGFDILRFFYKSYDIARICVEVRKEQLRGLEWDILPRAQAKNARRRLVGGGKTQEDSVPAGSLAAATKLKTFFERPDRLHDWPEWLGAVLEERLVLDALTINPWRTRGGDLYKLEVIDGSTIKLLLDERGSLPEPPAWAYQQTLLGRPMSLFTLDELLYKPQNVRAETPYGFSEIEGILYIVNMALRKRMKDLAHWTDGNVPRALLGMPAEWTPDQIEKWTLMFNALLQGNVEEQNKLIFIPGGGRATLPIHEFTPFTGDPQFDEWLLKVTCAMLRVTPAEIGWTDDVNRASSQGQENVQYRTSILPLSRFVAGTVNRILADFCGQPDLMFQWQMGETEDQVAKAQATHVYWTMGAIQTEEIRKDLGLEPLGITTPFIPGLTLASILKTADIDKAPEDLGLGPDGKALPPEDPNDPDGDEDGGSRGDEPDKPDAQKVEGKDETPPQLHLHINGAMQKVTASAFEKGEYGCLLFVAPASVAAAISRFQLALPAADVQALEDEPHITVKYGITTDDALAVQGALLDQGAVSVRFGPTAIFANPDADVLYVPVLSDDLLRLNQIVSARLPVMDTRPSYVPHLTVACLRPGSGGAYTGLDLLGETTVELRSLLFSPAGEAPDQSIVLTAAPGGGKTVPTFAKADDSPPPFTGLPRERYFAMRDELRTWRRVVRKSLRAHQSPDARTFHAAALPAPLYTTVREGVRELAKMDGAERELRADILFQSALTRVDEWQAAAARMEAG